MPTTMDLAGTKALPMLSPLIQREDRHGGIVVLHVQAGMPAERRASLLIEVLETLPDESTRHVLVAFSPGTELCCTSLWALSNLADRCSKAKGTLCVSGLGDATLQAATQAGILRRFMVVEEPDEGVARLLSAASGSPKQGFRKLFGRAA